MIALSVRQPWAELIAAGHKPIETRTWATNYRGPLLIVAGLQKTAHALQDFGYLGLRELDGPRGCAVAIVHLYDVRLMARGDEAGALVPWRLGLFAWRLRLVKRVKPFRVKGRLGLFEVEMPEGGVR